MGLELGHCYLPRVANPCYCVVSRFDGMPDLRFRSGETCTLLAREKR
jgi:hypothetical protein